MSESWFNAVSGTEAIFTARTFLRLQTIIKVPMKAGTTKAGRTPLVLTKNKLTGGLFPFTHDPR